jgi:hypothetical protein
MAVPNERFSALVWATNIVAMVGTKITASKIAVENRRFGVVSFGCGDVIAGK